MSTPLNLQLIRLSTLLQLEQRARKASAAELRFLMVNDTATILPYQQAALWRQTRTGGRLAAVSGAATVEAGAPYTAWLQAVLAAIIRGPRALALHTVGPEELTPAARRAWAEWFPSSALWCPLESPDGELLGGLLLGREEPWRDADQLLLEPLMAAYSHAALVADLPRRRRRPRRRLGGRRLLLGAAAVALIAAALLPVRQSMLAPAEIVPLNPVPVRAPFEGVVNLIRVTPNAVVHAGDRLLALDTTELETRLQVARKELEIAREDYSEASQQALLDAKAKAKLPVLQSRIDQHDAEVAYSKGLLDKAEVSASIDGIAVFNDADEWTGKPVQLGERIMQLWSPSDAQIEIQVPAADVITFKPDAEALFFRNIAPDQPARAHVVFASYGTAVTPEGVLSYVFRARLDELPRDLRLGEKGTAKIYGPSQALILSVLRKPLAKLREWLWL
ncbi:MAG: HlyD family efflux transporter periplasmic adaptor subunit [Pseudomonadota bacterium]